MPWSIVVVILILAIFAGFCVWCLTRMEPTGLPSPDRTPTWIIKKTKKTERKEAEE